MAHQFRSPAFVGEHHAQQHRATVDPLADPLASTSLNLDLDLDLDLNDDGSFSALSSITNRHSHAASADPYDALSVSARHPATALAANRPRADNSKKEWVLFDPSSDNDDNDILSSSSQGPSNPYSNIYNSVQQSVEHTRSLQKAVSNIDANDDRGDDNPGDEDPDDDESLVDLLLLQPSRKPNFRLQLPGHDGAGLFHESLLADTIGTAGTSLNDRIDEWQKNQALSLFEEKQKHTIYYSTASSASLANEVAESWGVDNHHHFYSHTAPTGYGPTSHRRNSAYSTALFKRLLNNNNRVSKRFYGDYLLKGLNDKDVTKVKRTAKELSSNLTSKPREENKDDKEQSKDTWKNTIGNKSSLAFNPMLRPLLLSTFLINHRLYHASGNNSRSSISSGANEKEDRELTTANLLVHSHKSAMEQSASGDQSGEQDNFWQNDAQSIYSSRLSDTSWSSGLWQSDSWTQVI